MAMTEQDISILRTLAERVAELAAAPENQEKMDLWSRKTDLDSSVRPLV